MNLKALAQEHERLLFQRAFPATEAEAFQADKELLAFSDRVRVLRESGHDLTALENSDICGIAGTGMTAVFSYGVAWHLAATHPAAIDIAWDAYYPQDMLCFLLPELIPALSEEALVEAHVNWRDWVTTAAAGQIPLRWLLQAIQHRWPDVQEAADRYDSMQIPLHWDFGNSSATRTRMRLPVQEIFCHKGAPLTRHNINLDDIATQPPLPIRKLSPDCGSLILGLARDTSAVRYRELHAFTWGDPRQVTELDAGRGLRFYHCGLAPAHRLPWRACHSLSIWKNGVPIGYFEGLSLCERMESGFNLYFTFRAGETAYLYAQVLRAMHQLSGATTFVLDPYQLGHENPEGLQSGAFWFYRKLGFRSTCPKTQTLIEREEQRLLANPGKRTAPAGLRRLVAQPMIYELPQARHGAWDQFSMHRFNLSAAAAGLLPPRSRPTKALREAILRLGTPPA
jgi:hypothetical protein